MASSAGNSSWKNYVASVSAGVVSICTFNSLDTLRVRWQVVDKAAYKSLSEYGLFILRSEGFVRGLQTPGLISNMLAVGTSTGLRLGMYPRVREIFSGGKLDAKEVSATTMFFSGLCCGMLSYLISTPLWSVKTRQQGEVGMNPQGTRLGTVHLLLTERQARGIIGLWRGATPLVARGGLVSAGQIGGYDFSKSRLKMYNIFDDGPVLHIVSSLISAVVASTVSLPVDVLFSRYVSRPNTTLLECVRELQRERAFFRGWVALVSRLAPTFALAMPIYERIRFLLGLGFL